MFKDGELVQKVLDTQWWRDQVRLKVNLSDVRQLGITSFKLKRAYLESDIIWPNLKSNRTIATVKRLFLFLLLLVVSFVILTPSNSITFLKPVQDALERKLTNETISGYVAAYFAPLVSLCINFGVIPLFIDGSTEIEDFRRKSSKQISIMNRIYFFMFINTLIIPITQTTALLFFQDLSQKSIDTWPSMLSSNLMAT